MSYMQFFIMELVFALHGNHLFLITSVFQLPALTSSSDLELPENVPAPGHSITSSDPSYQSHFTNEEIQEFKLFLQDRKASK